MNDELAQPLLERLDHLQTGLESLGRRMSALADRLSRLEAARASLLRDLARVARMGADLSVRLDHDEGRLERVEARLDLGD